ncbi:Rieske 2Fe-2S domain-containing protein, partial [Acidiphilium sp.]|uniref:Rieske 2Fe-2S domain-containing protein n=1 Tax=Acidiphilium sp. TaxID=527 RepID=UPI002CE3A03B
MALPCRLVLTVQGETTTMNSDVLVKNTWYIVGLSQDFQKDVLQGQVVAERPIVMWRTKTGNVVAFDDRCCHKRMPLSAGKLIEGGLLQCAYHGLCYDAAGACVRVPAHPDGMIPPAAKLREVPLMEQDGLVWVWPGDPALAEGTHPPRTQEVVSPDWDTADVKGPVPVPCNSLLLIENLLDITHFFPLHDGNIGDVENSKIPVKLEEGVKDGHAYVGTVREVAGYRQPPFLEEYFGYEKVDRHHTHFMLNPGLTRVQMRVWPEGKMGDAASERGYIIL